jgi:hypothetical protein
MMIPGSYIHSFRSCSSEILGMSRIDDDAYHAVLVNSVIALAFWCFPPRFALSSAFLDIPRAQPLESNRA